MIQTFIKNFYKDDFNIYMKALEILEQELIYSRDLGLQNFDIRDDYVLAQISEEPFEPTCEEAYGINNVMKNIVNISNEMGILDAVDYSYGKSSKDWISVIYFTTERKNKMISKMLSFIKKILFGGKTKNVSDLDKIRFKASEELLEDLQMALYYGRSSFSIYDHSTLFFNPWGISNKDLFDEISEISKRHGLNVIDESYLKGNGSTGRKLKIELK